MKSKEDNARDMAFSLASDQSDLLHARKMELLNRLRPIDDRFFEKLMEDRSVCQEILRVILEDDTLLVDKVIPQNSIGNLQGRSVRLDALCTLGICKKCNIEVQISKNPDHFRRVRYHASCITANVTDPGQKFRDVPDVCIVYISTFDVFGEGQTIYHVHAVVDETGEIMQDGLSYVFVNTEIPSTSKIGRLMQCFLQSEDLDEEFSALANRVDFLKRTTEGVDIMDDVCKELIDLGKEQGIEQGIITTCKDLGVSFIDTVERVARKFNMTQEAAEARVNKYW